MLTPIMTAAEQAYEAQLRANPDVQKRLAAAGAAEQKGASGSLRGLSRFEQQIILRTVTPPSQRFVEPDVRIWRPAGGFGKVENIDRYAGDPGMVSRLLGTGRRHGATRRDVENVLTTHPADLDKTLGNLEGKMVTIGRATTIRGRAERGAFLRNLRRASFLHQAFEPARHEGIPTTTAVSSVMLRTGGIRVQDVMGSAGVMAPMTPVGAAPETLRDLTPEERQAALDPDQRRAAALRERRVGRVFRALLTEGKKANIFVTEGGYDLSILANVISQWLDAKKRRYPDPDKLKDATRLLEAEFLILLEKYHGRG
jgi:hypothetical protein